MFYDNKNVYSKWLNYRICGFIKTSMKVSYKHFSIQ